MKSLFDSEPIVFDVPDASISYYPNFFSNEEAAILFGALQKEIPWQQDDIKVYGKVYPQPRLTALFGNEGKSYSYSHLIMHPHKWSPLLLTIKEKVEKATETIYSTVLLNYYRDGKDSNGWHADNEKELGTNPIIASLSFGAERVFQLKHNHLQNQKINLTLEHGSLLLMKGTTQHFWKHQIPKTTKQIGSRINLTFRIIK
ncbi:alpha-ketoglutarate-dependent dioxygenase AlkB [Flavobacterium sp.]|uniref:alpha-ketoglutarate-dependent dioxygenase AlkB family protein n=1 Tax=Flavobacterium sp. TaxID=239 RepID=UPI00262D8B55|nr:alpha-ketoglutarate-dependent dioxygenase AlkB [Flavobacterium sp.]